MTTHQENERIAKLEVLVKHIDEQQEQIAFKVNTMHDILQQLKGAKWIGLILAATIGFIVSKADFLVNYIIQGRTP